MLSRDYLRNVLGPPSPFGPLSAVDLADQIEMIKITPVYLSTEDLSKMWTAMQARYRPTMAYLASVVLIEATNGVNAAPPVLKRGAGDTGPVATAVPIPNLTGVRVEASELLPAMRLGDDLLVRGTSLDDIASLTAVLEEAKSGLTQEGAPTSHTSPGSIRIHIPSIADDADAMNEWAIGLYKLTLRVARPSLPEWTTNTLAIPLAPLINVAPLNAAPGDVLTLSCSPRLLSEQHAHTTVIFGSQSITPTTITTDQIDLTQPTTLDFTVPAVAAGEYMVRLRVSGIDSLPIVIAGSPPTFDLDPQQKVTVA
jgi:hypothetical protein